MSEILDKDLPDITLADIKLDTSRVDLLKPIELKTVIEQYAMTRRSNDQLLLLIQQCPEKVARCQEMIDRGKDKDGLLAKKIVVLKDQYAVVIKEIAARKVAVK